MADDINKNTNPQIEKWMTELTLDEKIRLVMGMGMIFPEGTDLEELAAAGIDEIHEGLPTPVEGIDPNPVPGQAATTYPVTRLGINALVLADGPAGLRIEPIREGDQETYYATAFPIATLLASSWDPDLLEKVGIAMGEETLEYGVDVILMPALNLHRNPLCGRNFEYFSEDPLLSGKMAAAMVRGVQSRGVGTSIKHLAANNQETNRTTVDSVLTERVIRELYLPGFEIAIKESRPWTVMSSYNKINGTYTSESHDLLTKILRKEWGYEGLVMTDWFAGRNAAAQLKAGNDLLMPGTQNQHEAIKEAISNRQLTEADLDINVRRILNLLTLCPNTLGYDFSNKPELKAHADVARDAAAQGMVLLKNESKSLPLPEGKKLALFGNASFELVTGGTGSGDVNEAYTIPLDAGIEMAGSTIDEILEVRYTQYIEKEKAALIKPKNPLFLPPPIPEMVMDSESVFNAAKSNDAAIVTLGRNSGEFADRELESDFLLSETELQLLEMVSKAFRAQNKSVIVVLNIGGVIETASWKNLADAILIAWQPGQEGGNAIADVLFGKVNPSGKLTMSFPIDYEDVPAARNFSHTPTENPTETRYEEGLYVGYRYFNSFDVPVSYPFGHGLTYTQFEIGRPCLSNPFFIDSIQVEVPVKNTGDSAGKQVVQLYLSVPEGELENPKMELKAFAKTPELQPGEMIKLSLSLDARSLASYDPNKAAWIAEQGTYTVHIGTSATELHSYTTFECLETQVVEQLQNLLQSENPIQELTRK